jgi:hypothetical protein
MALAAGRPNIFFCADWDGSMFFPVMMLAPELG